MSAIAFLSEVSWLWTLPTLWICVWVLGFVLLGTELSNAKYGSPPGGKPALACALIAIALSAAAFLVMTW